MTKLSCGPLWKENNKWENVGLCYILSMTNLQKKKIGPYIRLGEPIYGFRSMVLDASACINMYYNIERNIMKNQAGSPDFGIQGKISVYMCFMCYALALFILCVLEFVCR